METILRTYHTSKDISDKNLSIQLFKKSKSEAINKPELVFEKLEFVYLFLNFTESIFLGS